MSTREERARLIAAQGRESPREWAERMLRLNRPELFKEPEEEESRGFLEQARGVMDNLSTFLRAPEAIGSLLVTEGLQRLAGDREVRAIAGASQNARQRLGQLIAIGGEAGRTGLAEPTASTIALLGIGAQHFTPGRTRGREPKLATTLFDVSEWVREVGDDFADYAFAQAESLGLSHDEIIDSSTTGNIIGFSIPAFAAFKATRVIPFIGSAKSMPGFFARDGAAGGIYGFVFHDGDITDRLMESKKEAAWWSLTTIVVVGGIGTLVGLRNIRLVQKAHLEKERVNPLNRLEYDGDTGLLRLARLDDKQARILTEVLREEQYISQSPAAQKMVEQGKHIPAVLQALRDISRGEASVFVIRGTEGPERLSAHLKGEFPDAFFTFVKRGEGYDLVISKQKLTKEVRDQFRREKFVPGQHVDVDGVKYRYVEKGPKRTRVLEMNSDVVKQFPHDRVKDLPFVETPVEARPILIDRFIKWYREKLDALAAARESTPEQELVRSAREGRLEVRQRRDLREPDMLIHPEEAGLTQDRLAQLEKLTQQRIKEIMEHPELSPEIKQHAVKQLERIRDQAPEHILEEIARRGRQGTHISEVPEPVTFQEAVQVFMAENGLSGVDADVFTTWAAQELRRHIWRSLPEGERKLIRAIQKEHHDIVTAKGLDKNLDHQAAIRGFKVIRESDGTVTLRDANTGVALNFKNEHAALESAQRAIRDYPDDIAPILPRDALPGVTLMSGGNVPDGWWAVPDAITSARLSSANPLGPTGLKNIRDRLLQIQDEIGLPIFTRVFDALDRGIQLMNKALDIRGRLVNDAYKGLKIEDRLLHADFFFRTADMPSKEVARVAKEMGLSSKILNADKKLRRVLNRVTVDTGVDGNVYFREYYGRLRPYVERTGTPIDTDALRRIYPEGVPDDVRRLLDFARRTELPSIDKDPLVVAHRFLRSVYFEKEAGAAWSRARSLVSNEGNPLRIKDLTPEQQKIVLDGFGGGERGMRTLIELNRMLRDWTSRVRGYPDQDLQTLRAYLGNLAHKLGFDIDPRLGEELINTLLAIQYGSAIAFAPMMLARNLTQQIWMGFTRYGSKYVTKSLGKAMTYEGTAHAERALALRTQAKGSLLGDEIFRNFIRAQPIKGDGLVRSTIATAGNAGLRFGDAWRRTSQKFMTLYGSTDDFNRVWAFWHGRMHAEDAIRRFKAGKLTEKQFLKQAAPAHSRTIKQEFLERYRKFGEHDALDYIGREAANENHFIYGTMAQPLWMQRAPGKLISVFGSWPLWNKEAWVRAARNMDAGERFSFFARNVIVAGAIGNMSIHFGISLWNWMAPTGLVWTGGPLLDIFIDMKELVDAPFDRKARAAARLAHRMMYISWPGQRVWRDFTKPAEFTDDPLHWAVMVMLGRPDQNTQKYTDFIVDEPISKQQLFHDLNDPAVREFHQRRDMHDMAEEIRRRPPLLRGLLPAGADTSSQIPNARN